MFNRKISSILLGASLVCCLPACEKKYEGEEWTYLVYAHADNNLDGAIVSDLQEMLNVKGTGATFVVQVDRNPDYGRRSLSELPFNEEVQRLVISDRELTVVGELGELDSSDPQVLEDFLTWGLENYDSDHVAIIHWNHGGGWIGFGHDETDDSGIVSLPDITNAVSSALSKVEREKVDILGFDSCLMGNLEVALSFKNLADYYLGSQENEPGHGWDYESMAIPIKGTDSVDAIAVGSEIIDGFKSQAKARGTESTITLSLLDLEKVPAVATAINEGFSALVGADIAEKFFESFSEADQQEFVSSVAEFSSVRAESVVFGADSTQLIDLHSLWQKAAELNSNLKEAADAVTAAIDAAVIKRVEGPFHEKTRGLSIYFPINSQRLSATYAQAEEIGLNEAWIRFFEVGDFLEIDELAFFFDELVFEAAENGRTAVKGRVLGNLDNQGVSPLDTISAVRLTIGRPRPENPTEVVLIANTLGSFNREDGVATGLYANREGFIVQGDKRFPVSGYGLSRSGVYQSFGIPVRYAETPEQPVEERIGLSWNVVLDENLEIVQGAFYRQEILNEGSPTCPTGGESVCERVFSEYAVAEGSSIFIEDIVLNTDTGVVSRATREDQIDPAKPFSIEIKEIDPEEELFFQLEVSDFYETSIQLNGFSTQPQ